MAKEVIKEKEAFVEVEVTATKIGKENIDTARIKVNKFHTETANVSVSAGATINLGNYESGRVQVMLSVPCYVEEIDSIFERTKEWVDVRLSQEVQELRGQK